jgi:hypothetical protein
MAWHLSIVTFRGIYTSTEEVIKTPRDKEETVSRLLLTLWEDEYHEYYEFKGSWGSRRHTGSKRAIACLVRVLGSDRRVNRKYAGSLIRLFLAYRRLTAWASLSAKKTSGNEEVSVLYCLRLTNLLNTVRTLMLYSVIQKSPALAYSSKNVI